MDEKEHFYTVELYPGAVEISGEAKTPLAIALLKPDGVEGVYMTIPVLDIEDGLISVVVKPMRKDE